jgi:hypothetical protein
MVNAHKLMPFHRETEQLHAKPSSSRKRFDKPASFYRFRGWSFGIFGIKKLLEKNFQIMM